MFEAQNGRRRMNPLVSQVKIHKAAAAIHTDETQCSSLDRVVQATGAAAACFTRPTELRALLQWLDEELPLSSPLLPRS